MPTQTHTEDPRTGCWTPAEGFTVESIYQAFRGELPLGATLVSICGTDGCANPDHVRPTLFVGTDYVERLDPEEGGHTSSKDDRVIHHGAREDCVYCPPVERTTESTSVKPSAPVKRGPGRPRKQR